MRALSVAAALLASPAMAQDDPLANALLGALAEVSDVENVGETLECAALFRALSMLLDPATEAGASFREREGTMASIAAMLWASGENRAAMTVDEVFAMLVPPLDATTGIYLEHMNDIAGETGSPFDDGLLSRVEFCIAVDDALDES